MNITVPDTSHVHPSHLTFLSCPAQPAGHTRSTELAHCCYCNPARLFLAPSPTSMAPTLLPATIWASTHPGCLPTALTIKPTQVLQLFPQKPRAFLRKCHFSQRPALQTDLLWLPFLSLPLTCFVPKGSIYIFTPLLPFLGGHCTRARPIHSYWCLQ